MRRQPRQHRQPQRAVAHGHGAAHMRDDPVHAAGVVGREQRLRARALHREIDFVVGLALDQAGHVRAQVVAVEEIAVEGMARHRAFAQFARVDIPVARLQPRRELLGRVDGLEIRFVLGEQLHHRIDDFIDGDLVAYRVPDHHRGVRRAGHIGQGAQALLPGTGIENALVQATDRSVHVGFFHLTHPLHSRQGNARRRRCV
ncbi:hypothetical protein D3C72_1399390 [compost metagenome]